MEEGVKLMRSECVLRAKVKSILPVFVRRILRSILHYAQRIGRWFIILWQARGVNWRDQLVLFMSALAAPVLSLNKLMTWQYPILLRDADVIVRNIGRFSLRQRSDDLWHVLPHREHAIANFLKMNLRPGDVFIDAGANIGIYTVMASKLVGPGGKVIAIEMMPDTADRLEHHIYINRLDNVTVIRRALDSVSGQIVEASVVKGKYGQASIVKPSANSSVTVIQVETITLDDVACGLNNVRLMKMDLEGAEYASLRGSAKLLGRLDYLIFESRGVLRTEDASEAKLLASANFNLAVLDGNNYLASKG